MRRLSVSLAGAIIATILLLVGCAQAAPTPTAAPAKPAEPTKAAAPAPTKAAEPTKAPAAAPTAAPAAKVAFPEKGKTMTIIVPWAAGSINDITTRLVSAFLEKELGIPIQVTNKPGASSQVGITELAMARPDGYTMALNSMPTTIIVYTDPERKATFGRKDLQPVAQVVAHAVHIIVKSDSPYKTTKDLIDAARANPDKIKVADSGIATPAQYGVIALGKVAGVKFANVHFNGDAECYTALLGGHVDASIGYPPGVQPMVKANQVRILGVMDKEPSKYLPDVVPFANQGLNVQMIIGAGYVAPGGTPKEIVDILSGAIKRVTQNPEFVAKIEENRLAIKYLDAAQYAAQWDQQEPMVKSLLADAAAAK